MVLSAAVGLLLLLACANVMRIMVSRMLARPRESGGPDRTLRGRGRILRGMITEGILLAIFGGFAGLIFAYGSLGLLVSFTAKFTSLASQLSFTPGAIAFCLLLSLVCGVVIGMAPSIGVRFMPPFTMERGNLGTPSRIGSKTRHGLVAMQLAFCVVLLVGAGTSAAYCALHRERVDVAPT